MLSVIGSLLGFGSSIIPEIIASKKEKELMKFKLEALKLQAEMKILLSETELKQFKEQQDFLVHEKLLEHDIAISGEEGIIGALRRSVRPVITYAFFGLFAFLKYSILADGIANDIPLIELAMAVWDEETQAIFAAVMSFWFGSRTIEKIRIRKLTSNK